MSRKKQITLVPYNPEWPEQFEAERIQIAKALTGNCIAIHHIGSTAIPGLSAKPRIDIIIESPRPKEAIRPLESLGFEYMGEFNIPFHYGFRRRTGVEVNLHMYEPGHPEIALNLTFRDYLLKNPYVRDEYQEYKLELLSKEDAAEKGLCKLSNYSARKGHLIRRTLEEADFYTPRITILSDDYEWNYVNMQEKIEDRCTPYPSPRHIYCMFYAGGEIVGYTYITKRSPEKYKIKRVFIEFEWQKQKNEFVSLVEKWIASKQQCHTL